MNNLTGSKSQQRQEFVGVNYQKPMRVLHYIKHLETGGGESLVFNLYQHIERDKVQFDFAVNTNYRTGWSHIPNLQKRTENYFIKTMEDNKRFLEIAEVTSLRYSTYTLLKWTRFILFKYSQKMWSRKCDLSHP